MKYTEKLPIENPQIKQQLLNLDIYLNLGPSFSFVFNAKEKQIILYSVSSELYHILGCGDRDTQIITLYDFFGHVHPEDIQVLLSLMKKIKALLRTSYVNQPEPFKLMADFRVKHAKGKYIRLLFHAESCKDVDKNGYCNWIGIASDISFIKMDGELTVNFFNEKQHGFFNHTQTKPSKSSSLFSPREQEVLKLLAQGYNSRQIEETLHISQHTVRTHKRNMHKKCKVENTSQLLKKASREGYI